MAFSSSSAAEKGLEAALSPVLVMRVSYQKTGEVILTHTVLPGDTVTVTLTHSFEHIPWNEYYTVLQDGSFLLKRIEVGGFGAGIPAEMDVPTRIEDGLVWMEGINSVFPQFSWITSDKYMKVFTLNDEAIFDFRSLPDASRIRGEIIERKGYLSK